jgi:hypothetical protein
VKVGSFRERFPMDREVGDSFTRSLPPDFCCPEYGEFLSRMSGATFGGGLYRIMNAEEAVRWNEVVQRNSDLESTRLVECFGYDWLGRIFALDSTRIEEGCNLVIMLEPGSGDIYRLPVGLAQFHRQLDDEDFADAALATLFWGEWQKTNAGGLARKKCVGYSVPLFLGGEDSIDNLEVIDMEVYWELLAQMRRQIDDLPEGTKIRSVTLAARRE